MLAGDPMKFSQIWIEQCEAARDIEFEFGVPQALDYLIADKFLKFVEAADDDDDFRDELPAFTAEIKTIFEPWQLADYFEQAMRQQPIDFNSVLDEDEDTVEMPILQRPDHRVWVERMKALLIG